MYSIESSDAMHIAGAAEVYIYDVQCVGDAVAAISSDDCLRLLDPLNLKSPPILQMNKINQDVNCMSTVSGEGSWLICTAGRDGKIHMLDTRTGKGVADVVNDNGTAILSLAASSKNMSIAAGTELANSQASINIWDLRGMNKPRVQYVDSHSDDITELRWHPLHDSILLSGGTDGLINLFNTSITDEEDALHQTINHGASIHHAGFLADTDVFALSHDEKFSITQMVTDLEESVEEPPVMDFGDLRQSLACEYVANVLSRPGGSGVIGTGRHSNEAFDLIYLRKDPPWTFAQESSVTLDEGHGSEIVRSFCFLDQHKMIMTGGEDGKIKAWRAA